MIKVLNYGSGNVKAITNIYRRLNVPCTTASTKDELLTAEKIIVPGVGAFDETMILLRNSGMLDSLNALVLDARVPVLGVCVGMQIMAKSSEEGSFPGLGWIEGRIQRVSTASLASKPYLPHMGWNSVKAAKRSPLFDGVDFATGFYFLHSYAFQCANPDNVLATVDYGDTFTAAVMSENVYGVQFHPEKSHHNGICVFRNFAGI